jgi:hypothetical protein
MMIDARHRDTLLRQLRNESAQQARPVVQSLFDGSGFPDKGAWGSDHIGLGFAVYRSLRTRPQSDRRASFLLRVFEGEDEIARMKSRLNPVGPGGVRHLYQRRAGCSRCCLLPQGDLCASRPLVSDAVRTKRNVELMEQQPDRAAR